MIPTVEKESWTAGPYTVAAGANALRALRLLNEQGTVTVTELSCALAIGKSTAHRVLATLIAEEFALRDPVRRTYHVGTALVAARFAVLGNPDLRRSITGPLSRLAIQTGETVMATVLEGGHTRVPILVRGSREPRASVRLGELHSAHVSAGGKLLLSYESKDRVSELLDPRLSSMTTNTISNWDELMVELMDIRDRGWSTNFEESKLGTHGLAVPMIDQKRNVFAALVLVAPAERLPRTRCLELVRQMYRTAEQITWLTTAKA